mgnify:FL=1
MTIEWETYQLTLTGRENGELAIRIQSFPPGEKFKFTGHAEVWIDERPLRVRGVQFYADGNDAEELKQDLLKWREAFKAMMETP